MEALHYVGLAVNLRYVCQDVVFVLGVVYQQENIFFSSSLSLKLKKTERKVCFFFLIPDTRHAWRFPVVREMRSSFCLSVCLSTLSN